MPVINPTGYPFLKTIMLPEDVEALQKLQVKVDLNKIGQAPRAFSEILKESMNQENIEIDSSSRMRICERFGKIQNAVRAMHPLTIQLLNESSGIFNSSTKVNLAPNTINQGDP